MPNIFIKKFVTALVNFTKGAVIPSISRLRKFVAIASCIGFLTPMRFGILSINIILIIAKIMMDKTIYVLILPSKIWSKGKRLIK